MLKENRRRKKARQRRLRGYADSSEDGSQSDSDFDPYPGANPPPPVGAPPLTWLFLNTATGEHHPITAEAAQKLLPTQLVKTGQVVVTELTSVTGLGGAEDVGIPSNIRKMDKTISLWLRRPGVCPIPLT